MEALQEQRSAVAVAKTETTFTNRRTEDRRREVPQPTNQLPPATPPPQRIDQRRHPRFTVEGDAEIVVKNGASLFRGRILNISESGCYIQTLAYVKLMHSTPVEILFVVSGKIVAVSAEARTSTPKVGIGFQFLSMHRETRSLLKTILSSLTLQNTGPYPPMQ